MYRNTYSLGLNVLNSGRGVHLISKNIVKLFEECSVVHHTSAIGNSVAGNEILDLLLSQGDVEGANAGAELIGFLNFKNCNLQRPLRQCLF